MKKLLFIFTCLFVFLVGCSSAKVKSTTIGDNPAIAITATQKESEITADTTLADYILALKESGKLDFEGENGEYGLFITSMDGKQNETISSTLNSSEGYSWNIYIDFVKNDEVIYANDGESLIYEDKTLYKATYGASSIPCIEGHMYVFVYEYYNFQW